MAGDDWSTRDFEAFSLLVAHGLAFTNSSGYRVDRCGELPRYMQECIAVSAFINNALIG
jgi:hypothetical protein